MKEQASTLHVEVAWATPERQRVIPLEVAAGTTVAEAVRRSGILEQCPEAVFDPERVGIHGRRVAPGDPLRNGDRVELYRPLIADPKDARRARAEQEKNR